MAMTKQQMIDALNEDLSYEFSAMLQYLTYAAKVSGPYRPQLSKFFMAEVPEETGHAQWLADKIVAMGGEPTTMARPVPPARTNRQMLEAILASETESTKRYTLRAKQAEEFGDKGLQVALENMVLDESTHREETERILRDWAL